MLRFKYYLLTIHQQETSQLRSRLRQALPKLKQAIEFRERIAQLETELKQKTEAGHGKFEEEKALLTAQIQMQEVCASIEHHR